MKSEKTSGPLSLPELGQRIAPRVFGPFAREALALYAAASGDNNPLHLDPSAAKSAGLQDTPVHGMLMFACFEPYLSGWRPDLFIARLSCKFLRPVFAGEGITISGRVVGKAPAPGKEIIVRLMARAPNHDLALVGEASMRCKDGCPAR
ncbi:MAG: MaoC family dehydratase [Methylocapsa sp.]|nr:MaoC family dehydratase [Methylocapsa sp.]